MTTLTVNSSTTLLSALNSAHAGDTILLASGTYDAVSINNVHFASAVTITSASKTNEAVISKLTINNSSGLNLTNVTLATTLYNNPNNAGAVTPFNISNSSNITLNGIQAHGTLDGNPQDDVNGLSIGSSSNIIVENSTFQQFYNAILEGNNQNISILNNSIHDIRSDGIDNSGSSNVTISGNTFTNFFPVGAVGTTGDHADAIQFWTSNTTSDASNITITNNTYVRGAGAAIQGIFVTDQVGLEYQNVTITGNSIIGSSYNAITVAAANNVNVSNNLVAGYTDQSNYIRLQADTNVTFNQNVSPQYYITTDTFTSQLSNQSTGLISAVSSVAAAAAAGRTTSISITSQLASVNERQTVTGTVLTGAHGSNLYLADVGVGAGAQKTVSSGSVFAGSYGALTVNPDGTYSYTAGKEGLTDGQTFDDHFTVTVASTAGAVQTTTLDFVITATGVGTAAANTIVASSGTDTLTGGGGADLLVAGAGKDTFVYHSLTDSTPTAADTIKGIRAGDIIDLSAVDPNFKIVSAFDGHANELVLHNDGNGAWEVYGDTTGSGTANFQIHLTGVQTAVNASLFHL